MCRAGSYRYRYSQWHQLGPDAVDTLDVVASEPQEGRRNASDVWKGKNRRRVAKWSKKGARAVCGPFYERVRVLSQPAYPWRDDRRAIKGAEDKPERRNGLAASNPAHNEENMNETDNLSERNRMITVENESRPVLALTRDVLFIEDVARVLRTSRSTIERRRRTGSFPVPELPRLDGRPRWSRQAVERFLTTTSNGMLPRRRHGGHLTAHRPSPKLVDPRMQHTK